jgi:hypothetical protein
MAVATLKLGDKIIAYRTIDGWSLHLSSRMAPAELLGLDNGSRVERVEAGVLDLFVASGLVALADALDRRATVAIMRGKPIRKRRGMQFVINALRSRLDRIKMQYGGGDFLQDSRLDELRESAADVFAVSPACSAGVIDAIPEGATARGF